jgi:two-component system chemotaxis response regulator CheY
LTAIIVDDSAVSRALLKAGLAKAGVEIVGEASTAEHALELYEQHNPSIVIFDIVLPHTDGITAATEVLKTHPDAIVIICTAVASPERIRACREVGVRYFLHKPITIQQVAELVDHHRAQASADHIPNESPSTADPFLIDDHLSGTGWFFMAD